MGSGAQNRFLDMLVCDADERKQKYSQALLVSFLAKEDYFQDFLGLRDLFVCLHRVRQECLRGM